MAERLKDFFDERVVRGIARDLRRAHHPFDERSFVQEGLSGLDDLELTQRAWHLAEAMQRHLPTSFPEAARILVASLDDALPSLDPTGMEPFRYLPHVFFVAKYGLEHFEPAMDAQYELTQRFTAEFSVRPFLVRHPEATYERLMHWTGDPNVHVRRLVSEGTRPRLPWAPRLRAFQRDPRPVVDLLERLKDAPERYVQRSVANNLNDIGKDHPQVLVEVCRNWTVPDPHTAGPREPQPQRAGSRQAQSQARQGQASQARSPQAQGRRWIVRHALRSLVKLGHPAALELLGVGEKPRVRIDAVRLAPQVSIGGELRFSFDLASTTRTDQELLVDYAVHFVKANGAARPKVFKLKKLSLPAASRVRLSSKISFRPMTTRTHHPGQHHIDLLINGVPHPLGDFDVRHDRASRER